MRNIELTRREQQIADLLLKGCDTQEIATELKMARRTVKAHFNRLFLRFGISTGIKRVRLAVILYRRRAALEAKKGEHHERIATEDTRNQLENNLGRDRRLFD
jgi:DNA-binding CsgD family transcriptional regulator